MEKQSLKPRAVVANPANRLRAARGARHGYVLVLCLLVIAVTSGIVLSLFNMLRLQTMEAHARRQIVAENLWFDAAHEHAVAELIDRPGFRGTLGPFSVPSLPGPGVNPVATYTLQIQDASGDIQVHCAVQCNGVIKSNSRIFSAAALQNRRLAIGL